jgi:hypothetical protein
MCTDTFTVEQASTILSQWYHPLHYFPTFLARFIAVCPNIPMQTYISKILWQELGEGDAARAHELIYKETMCRVGFDEHSFINVSPLESTRDLVTGYENSTHDFAPALGFTFATEVADLAMVSAIGTMVRNLTGAKELPWVDIHVVQEPDHVDSADLALAVQMTEHEENQVVMHAERMWKLWIDFFSGLEKATFHHISW